MITIDKGFQEKVPHIELICFQAEVRVVEDVPELWREIENYTGKFVSRLSTEGISQIPSNLATREAYKQLGKDPSRYRPSAEALLRRVVSGKGIYKINNVVDCLNFISVQTGFSIGGYDLEKINGQITLTCATAEDPYEAIGRGTLNIENLPVLKDETGCFGTPTSDSARTMVTDRTRKFLMVIFCFDKHFDQKQALEAMVADCLKKYAFSDQVEIFTIG